MLSVYSIKAQIKKKGYPIMIGLMARSTLGEIK